MKPLCSGAAAVAVLMLSVHAFAQTPAVPRPAPGANPRFPGAGQRPGQRVRPQRPVARPRAVVPPRRRLTDAVVDMSTFDANFASYIASITKRISNGRRVHQWHWVRREEALAGKNPSLSVRDRVFQHVMFLKQTFVDAVGFGLAGPAFYTAGDPSISSNFGSLHSGPAEEPSRWILVQTVLNGGLVFLDGVKGNSTMPEPLRAQIAQKGCHSAFGGLDPSQPPEAPNGISDVFAEAAISDKTEPRTPSNDACLALRRRAIELSGAVAMRFGFSTSRIEGCPQPQDAASPFLGGQLPANAFISWDERAFNFNEMVVFTDDPPLVSDPQQQNRVLIQDLFARAGKPLGPWPRLWGMKPSFDMDQFLQLNIMGCVPKGFRNHFPEDEII